MTRFTKRLWKPGRHGKRINKSINIEPEDVP